jgi:gluconokinase
MKPDRIVVMGVSGCGKSTVGQALAERLGYAFLEGDDLHPPENIQAMSAGIALDDAMRLPWLKEITRHLHTGSPGTVASCSALRCSYRDILRGPGEVVFIHLALDLNATLARMQARPRHFMNPSLAESQHASLEPLCDGELGMTVNASEKVDELIDLILQELQTVPTA